VSPYTIVHGYAVKCKPHVIFNMLTVGMHVRDRQTDRMHE